MFDVVGIGLNAIDYLVGHLICRGDGRTEREDHERQRHVPAVRVTEYIFRGEVRGCPIRPVLSWGE